ncbi:nicotinamidase-like [Lytechinus pictus]|uniref:nicotinamidase-like n=1 Tax=Lytechinus pictus TaxID=7653 RepID=UPI0030B9ECC0
MSAENFFDNLKNDLSFSGNREKEATCLKRYNKRGDGRLDQDEFHEMCLDLFVGDGKSFPLTETESRRIFEQLDDNQDNYIDREEFHILWRYWLPMILQPKAALIAVDVQNDFIDGSLAVAQAEEIVPVINRILDDEGMFEQVIYTYDWHPENHVSFHNNVCLRNIHHTSKVQQKNACVFDTVVFDGHVPMEQTLWPAHCVQHSHGAKLHADLKIAKDHVDIYKGVCDHVDSYSAFFDNQRLSQTELAVALCDRRITDVYICGLAYDVCVRHTAIDAASLGFRPFVIEDACRGLTTESCDKARREMEEAGCIMVSSTQVKSMAEADTRVPKMALQAAENVALARRKAKVQLASMNSDHEDKPLTNGFVVENSSLLDM